MSSIVSDIFRYLLHLISLYPYEKGIMLGLEIKKLNLREFILNPQVLFIFTVFAQTQTDSIYLVIGWLLTGLLVHTLIQWRYTEPLLCTKTPPGSLVYSGEQKRLDFCPWGASGHKGQLHCFLTEQSLLLFIRDGNHSLNHFMETPIMIRYSIKSLENLVSVFHILLLLWNIIDNLLAGTF